MAFKLFTNSGLRFTSADSWRSLLAGIVAIGIACGSVALAANNSVQGAKKDDGGYDTDAPTAILISLCWGIGTTMQIAAGIIARIRADADASATS